MEGLKVEGLEVDIQGFCEPAWRPVEDAFRANFDDGLELGASLAVAAAAASSRSANSVDCIVLLLDWWWINRPEWLRSASNQRTRREFSRESRRR